MFSQYKGSMLKPPNCDGCTNRRDMRTEYGDGCVHLCCILLDDGGVCLQSPFKNLVVERRKKREFKATFLLEFILKF